MRVPTAEAIESEFQVLDDDYAADDFYGGAFEGSHSFADLVVLRLYSIVPEDGDTLRVETRHHYAGRVIDHRRTAFDLDGDRSVVDADQSLEAFCRDHHFENPREELCELVEAVRDDARWT